jgi:hypothetical protein
MERHLNTYQGINKDAAYDSIPPSLYLDALDIRISTDTGESIGAWTNIKGNVQSFTIPISGTFGEPPAAWTAANPEIIGFTTIRNRIIVFVADDSGTKGWIYDVQYDTATRDILPGFPALIYYNANLNFKKEWPIEALGRYETDCVQRVYWADYNNYFRTINIEEPGLNILPVGQVDIFPDIEYTQPLLKIIGGGTLATGLYQVAYRLKTIDGKETLISPPGNIIHVVSDSETLVQSARYNGNGTIINSGKSLQVEVDVSNYFDFDKIEFIVIYNESFNSVPLVLSVEELTIGTTSPATFIYTGNEGSAFPLTLFEFTTKNHPFKTPKTITQKDSSLVIANIKSSSISVQDLLPAGETFDAKARRYKNIGGTITTPFPIDPNPSDPTENNLKNAFNEEYNRDAHWDSNWHANSQYRYQADGITLGGESPNISYKFHLEPYTLDAAKTQGNGGFANVSNFPDFVYTHDLNDGYGQYANTTFPNHASPFISGLLRGYKRGETYRFGIVFYTNKGEASFVEYIGDIKFPDISEQDSSNNASGTNYWPISQKDPTNTGVILGYSMGIEFTIDFSSCPSIFNSIESYQIVRVKRQDSDKRRFTQGMVKNFYLNVIQSPTITDVDFRATGFSNSTNVLHILPSAAYFSGARLPHSFGLMGDSQDPNSTLPLSTPPPGDDYLIKSQYLGFYSPEISFNFGNTRNAVNSLSNRPCLLMTGAYDAANFDPLTAPGTPIVGTGVHTNYQIEWTAGIPSTSIDLSGPENLAKEAVDIRKKYGATVPITYNSIENIKRLKETALFSMIDTIDLQTPVTPLWTSLTGGYHVRNYWAMDDGQAGDHLNDPSSTGFSSRTEVSKGGTSLLTLTDRFLNDPLNNNAVTPAATDYFRINGNTTLPGGISALYTTNTNPNPGIVNEFYPILDLVFPKEEVYGGFSKNALENNFFIIASPVIALANNNPKVFGGDTFVSFFTSQTSTVVLDEKYFDLDLSGNPKDYARSNARTELIPVETTMNLELAYGATTRTEVFYTFAGSEFTILRQEINNSRTTYGKTDSLMYAYNPLYTRENQELTFIIEPETSKDCKVNDIRAYLSNVKINDERIDSWTKFGINNFYDIDDYGPINKILNYKDTVYFFQDRAFGGYAINRAAITTTADGVPTELGTGEGFGKHQYISKSNGSIHQWAIKPTDTAIYFFDAINRKIFAFAASSGQSSNAPLSEIAGIHSWLKFLPDAVFYRKENGGDNPILKKGAHIGRDAINDEVIFTFLGTGNFVNLEVSTTYSVGTIVFSIVSGLYYVVTTEFTSDDDKVQALLDLLANSVVLSEENNFRDDSIVFDELTKTFITRHSATPKIWIDNQDILLSPSSKNSSAIYTHNIGNWGEFYNVVEEAKITLVINPNADINKILRTLEFNSIVRDNNKVVDRTKTITAFEIVNEYQSTGKVPFSANRIKRKFDKWRIKIPRNQLSAAQQDRLRSTHFVVTFYFDNLENKEIICNRLMSYYDIQIF